MPSSTPLAFLTLTTIALALPACSSGSMHPDHAFTTHAFVTSAAGIDESDVIHRGIDQIINRGKSAGFVIEETSDRLVTLVSTTATPTGAPSGSADTIEDHRRVVARAEFRTNHDGIQYDYSISLRGSRPEHTTAEHERNVIAGLFMIREVFERPLDVDLSAYHIAR